MIIIAHFKAVIFILSLINSKTQSGLWLRTEALSAALLEASFDTQQPSWLTPLGTYFGRGETLNFKVRGHKQIGVTKHFYCRIFTIKKQLQWIVAVIFFYDESS